MSNGYMYKQKKKKKISYSINSDLYWLEILKNYVPLKCKQVLDCNITKYGHFDFNWHI